jgi:serine phosphatase RsbU (regulator of sigma subunit)/anti-sigma regulatory factor (Ser/Thr protein kinase)
MPSATHVPSRSVTGPAWHWSGPSTLHAVREAGIGLRSFLASHGIDDEHELAAWELIISEAGNNAVEHACASSPDQSWDIKAMIRPDRISVSIHDHTTGFDWPESPELPDDSAESGRGIFLIHSLTDHRTYTRLHHENILTLERKFSFDLPHLTDCINRLETTLDGMTEELASCYESLSAIFHFTAESRQSSSLAEFAERLLRHLITVTRSDGGILRVVSGSDLIPLASIGCPDNSLCSSNALEAAAISSRQDQWIDADSIHSPSDTSLLAGLVHPFYSGDELMGVISLGRYSSPTPLNAGEVSIVHTFAEFFNQEALSRRHAEAAIAASVARREFELAATIQKSLEPRAQAPVAGVSAAGHCESALTIGGDFYDIIPWNNMGFFFVIADVMGKGVAASMMAAVTRSVFRSMHELQQSPARAVARAASQLFDDFDRLEMFVTVAVGFVDNRSHLIRIANAGHCPVIVADAAGNFVEVMPSHPPIGILRSPDFDETSIPITKGTRILAYTDGLTDPRNSRPSFSEPADVSAWMAETCRSQPSAADIREQLLQRIASSSAPDAPALADDQTFLIIACD